MRPSILVLFLYVGLTSDAQALKLNVGDDAGCTDTSLEGELSDLVGAVASFFRLKGITIYPNVLSMVAALRTGGLSLKLNSERHMLDHDLDFLVVQPEWMGAMALEQLTREFAEYAKNVTGVDAKMLQYPLESLVQHEELKWIAKYYDTTSIVRTVNGHFRTSNVAMMRRTSVTDKFNNDGIFDGDLRWWEKRFYEHRKTNASKLPKSLKALLGGKWQFDFTDINFFFLDHVDRHRFEASAKRSLLMGHEFPFPRDPNVIHDALVDEFGRYHPGYRTTSLCDFWLPADVYEEDVPSSPEATQLVKKCTRRLHNLGYASFQYCEK